MGRRPHGMTLRYGATRGCLGRSSPEYPPPLLWFVSGEYISAAGRSAASLCRAANAAAVPLLPASDLIDRFPPPPPTPFPAARPRLPRAGTGEPGGPDGGPVLLKPRRSARRRSLQ